MIKLCVDCKYHKKVLFIKDSCRAPENVRINVVNGKKYFIDQDCKTNRTMHSGCSVLGKWFVKKEAK